LTATYDTLPEFIHKVIHRISLDSEIRF